MRRMSRERGIVTAFVVMWSFALIAMTGLVLDGGRVLAEKREARNVAESAARAGAQKLNAQAVRNGDAVVLDGNEAPLAACAFAARAGYHCPDTATARAEGNEVIVTITETTRLLLLPMADQTFRVEGTACVARGITGGEATAVC
ncbi:MAG: pilus assembly protein TadG-related protein [Acidimicrobiales bacterium]